MMMMVFWPNLLATPPKLEKSKINEFFLCFYYQSVLLSTGGRQFDNGHHKNHYHVRSCATTVLSCPYRVLTPTTGWRIESLPAVSLFFCLPIRTSPLWEWKFSSSWNLLSWSPAKSVCQEVDRLSVWEVYLVGWVESEFALVPHWHCSG